MIISEEVLIQEIRKAKRILLLEPPFPRKYPPLSLAKISTFCKKHNIETVYSRHMVYEKFDLILMSTLFTYYSDIVKDTINSRGIYHRNTPIIVGGVFASLMPKFFDQFKNLNTYVGYSKELDYNIPDRAIMDQADPPWDSFSWVFTSRGCPNFCPYCAVWRIEKERWINPKWQDHIFDDKPNILISDNNLSGTTKEHFHTIIDYANKKGKAIMFEGGVDCKYVDMDFAKKLASAKYVRHGLRMAFDRIDEDGIFQTAVRNLVKAGVSTESNMEVFLLFNFDDTPRDAYYRGKEAYHLGIHQVYPMFYRPLNALSKADPFVGKYWTFNLARAFRMYWLQRRWFKYYSFEQYIELQGTREMFNLTDEDMDKWYNPTVPFHEVTERKLIIRKR